MLAAHRARLVVQCDGAASHVRRFSRKEKLRVFSAPSFSFVGPEVRSDAKFVDRFEATICFAVWLFRIGFFLLTMR